ncbi:MAG: HsdM family class I SAM-dependent methyltransferase, partial [Rhabdochlamydiaceae bacterium]
MEASQQWKGILPDQAESRLTHEHLTVCVEMLQHYSLLSANLEAIDAAFEYLVSRVAKGAKGQYFTPRYVIECCVQIMQPGSGEMVLDPACGSGGFLIHAASYVKDSSPSLNLEEYCKANLWGCEFDNRAIRVAKALMLISGYETTNLFRLNSLLNLAQHGSLFENEATSQLTVEDVTNLYLPGFKGFDIILTNPPFAGEMKEPGVLEAYELSRGKQAIERDVLFLERCIQLLRPGGRLAIIMPVNKLGANSWTYLRTWLVQRVRIVSILSLGRNTFLPHTHQKADILFAIKRKQVISHPTNEEILFLISEKDGKDSRGQLITRPGAQPDEAVWTRVNHDLGELVTDFHNFVRSSNI